jgi:hypothetical protein
MVNIAWNYALAAIFMTICSVAYGEGVDLCEILRTPSAFSGKMITVRATTWHGMENAGLKNDECKTPLHWRTPEDAGVRVQFKLKRDESWQTFTHYDAMSSEVHSFPSPEPQYLVTATFHGLLVYRPRQSPWLILVVESLSDVKVEPD